MITEGLAPLTSSYMIFILTDVSNKSFSSKESIKSVKIKLDFD